MSPIGDSRSIRSTNYLASSAYSLTDVDLVALTTIASSEMSRYVSAIFNGGAGGVHPESGDARGSEVRGGEHDDVLFPALSSYRAGVGGVCRGHARGRASFLRACVYVGGARSDVTRYLLPLMRWLQVTAS